MNNTVYALFNVKQNGQIVPIAPFTSKEAIGDLELATPQNDGLMSAAFAEILVNLPKPYYFSIDENGPYMDSDVMANVLEAGVDDSGPYIQSDTQ